MNNHAEYIRRRREQFVAQGLTVHGKARINNRHPELYGLTLNRDGRRKYQKLYREKRRQAIDAAIAKEKTDE